MKSLAPQKQNFGFSLFEVVLAVGVLSVSILALLGLFGPTMASVKDVVDNNEANGVRTRLNAALMSDEIYKVYGLDTALSTRFTDFAEALNDPAADPRDPLILYFWQERDQLESPLVLVYTNDPKSGDEQMDLSEVEGSAFIVALERGMQSGTAAQKYDFDDVANQGHFPILVSIYPVAPGDMISKTPADFVTLVNETEPLFTYTTAKLR